MTLHNRHIQTNGHHIEHNNRTNGQIWIYSDPVDEAVIYHFDLFKVENTGQDYYCENGKANILRNLLL